MATYKQPCIHCGAFIARDARLCPRCHRQSPFSHHCPSCLREIEKGQQVCSACGRRLYVLCPNCKQDTFVGERCEACGAGLMVYCTNPRCAQMQFFENINCTACGKKIKRQVGGR